MTRKITLATTATTLIALPTMAMSQMSGTGELGFSNNTGNTENTAFYASLKLNYEKDRYLLKSLIESSYKSENGEQTEERYLVDVQNNYFYAEDKNYYSFVGVRLEKNEFEDIDLDSTISLGMGKRLYKTEQTQLNGELGVGYQNTDYVTSGVDSESQGVAIGKLDLKHQFNQQVSFLQDLTVRSGNERTKYESNTGFKVKVAEKANLKISYKYRHNDKPAEGTKKTDTQTLVTLTYDF